MRDTTYSHTFEGCVVTGEDTHKVRILQYVDQGGHHEDENMFNFCGFSRLKIQSCHIKFTMS